MSFWLDELQRASTEERDWRKRAARVVDRYVDQRRKERGHDDFEKITKFNILWSTTETLRPALISNVPIRKTIP